MRSLIPTAQNPFFIVAPPYSRGSAGIVCLYVLCDQLNREGFSAYILPYPYRKTYRRPGKNEVDTVHNYLCPIATPEIIRFYDNLKLTPITIYPEVFDNVYRASFFGRYILNHPGLLGPLFTEVEDFRVFYSRGLAEAYWKEDPKAKTDPILFLPTCDLTYWSPQSSQERAGACYYAHKTKVLGLFEPSVLPGDAIEILPASQMSRDEVRHILQTSQMFYCFEDTALGIEARLCGCPVTWVPNAGFSGTPLAEAETGRFGSYVHGEEAPQGDASNQVHKFRDHISQHIEETGEVISKLARNWIEMAQNRAYTGTINPYGPPDYGVPRTRNSSTRHALREASRNIRRSILWLKYKLSTM